MHDRSSAEGAIYGCSATTHAPSDEESGFSLLIILPNILACSMINIVRCFV